MQGFSIFKPGSIPGAATNPLKCFHTFLNIISADCAIHQKYAPQSLPSRL